jgi:hypothetical protein
MLNYKHLQNKSANMTITQVSWNLINTASVAATAIADKTNAINTTNKYAGLMVWDTTNTRLMRASGATDVSPWNCVDGSVTVTPA